MSHQLPVETAVTFTQENPKKEGGKSKDRYEKYKVARTIEEAINLGAVQGDIKNDLMQGYMTTVDQEVGEQAKARIKAAESVGKLKVGTLVRMQAAPPAASSAEPSGAAAEATPPRYGLVAKVSARPEDPRESRFSVRLIVNGKSSDTVQDFSLTDLTIVPPTEAKELRQTLGLGEIGKEAPAERQRRAQEALQRNFANMHGAAPPGQGARLVRQNLAMAEPGNAAGHAAGHANPVPQPFPPGVHFGMQMPPAAAGHRVPFPGRFLGQPPAIAAMDANVEEQLKQQLLRNWGRCFEAGFGEEAHKTMIKYMREELHKRRAAQQVPAAHGVPGNDAGFGFGNPRAPVFGEQPRQGGLFADPGRQAGRQGGMFGQGQGGMFGEPARQGGMFGEPARQGGFLDQVRQQRGLFLGGFAQGPQEGRVLGEAPRQGGPPAPAEGAPAGAAAAAAGGLFAAGGIFGAAPAGGIFAAAAAAAAGPPAPAEGGGVFAAGGPPVMAGGIFAEQDRREQQEAFPAGAEQRLQQPKRAVFGGVELPNFGAPVEQHADGPPRKKVALAAEQEGPPANDPAASAADEGEQPNLEEAAPAAAPQEEEYDF